MLGAVVWMQLFEALTFGELVVGGGGCGVGDESELDFFCVDDDEPDSYKKCAVNSLRAVD